MPSVADLDVSVSPRDDPLCYPGSIPRRSYLWLDSWVYDLARTARAELGDWPLKVDGGPAAALDPATDRLSAVLAAAGVAALPDRYPVLAYGSNAATAQLRDKFAGLDPGRRVVPVTCGRLTGFALAHSAHVSNPGYVPFVLVDGGGTAALDVRVLWLDDDQLAVLTETEPNYDLVPVSGSGYSLTLESGHPVPRYSAYRGKWGALCWPGETGPAAAGTQQVVHEGLGRVDWFADLAGRDDVRAQVEVLRADKGLRDRVRVELANRRMAVPDGWIGHASIG